MDPSEEAAVEAAVRAARAASRRSGRGRNAAGPSAAERLDERLDGLEWESFDGRGYQLLREVARRRGFGPREPNSPRWDDHAEIGGKYEDRYSPARERISRALPA